MRKDVPGDGRPREESEWTTTTTTTSVPVLLKVTMNASGSRTTSPIRFVSTKMIKLPAGMALAEYLLLIDAELLRVVASAPLTDDQITEVISEKFQAEHGLMPSLHLVRRRLFNLYLRKYVRRERAAGQRYFLHPRREADVKAALQHEREVPV